MCPPRGCKTHLKGGLRTRSHDVTLLLNRLLCCWAYKQSRRSVATVCTRSRGNCSESSVGKSGCVAVLGSARLFLIGEPHAPLISEGEHTIELDWHGTPDKRTWVKHIKLVLPHTLLSNLTLNKLGRELNELSRLGKPAQLWIDWLEEIFQGLLACVWCDVKQSLKDVKLCSMAVGLLVAGRSRFRLKAFLGPSMLAAFIAV